MKNIAIVAGGDSSEYGVSLRSAEGILSFMDKEKFNPVVVELRGQQWFALYNGERLPMNKADFSFATPEGTFTFDFAYITIHGTPGENGLLGSYFELIRMPYSTCPPLISAMTFNKFVLNQYLRSLGVRVAESLTLRRQDRITADDVVKAVGLPCFVKPTCGGSSCATTKVKTPEELLPAVEAAFGEADEVMIEAFMQGTEITCGCYKTSRRSVVLPITEVVAKNEFFDYDAKYNGAVEEITPARIEESIAERVRTLTSLLYDILRCRGIIRIDYIITEGNKLNLLEINTTPGMTATSFIPQQVRAAGLDIKDVLTEIIEDSF
jgi:D-alanine-D-alanine ligase